MFTEKVYDKNNKHAKLFFGDASQSCIIGVWNAPVYIPFESIINDNKVVKYANSVKFYHKLDTKKGREKLLHMFRSIFK